MFNIGKVLQNSIWPTLGMVKPDQPVSAQPAQQGVVNTSAPWMSGYNSAAYDPNAGHPHPSTLPMFASAQNPYGFKAYQGEAPLQATPTSVSGFNTLAPGYQHWLNQQPVQSQQQPAQPQGTVINTSAPWMNAGNGIGQLIQQAVSQPQQAPGRATIQPIMGGPRQLIA
jgi:hypothetical protein